jgi:hypothetical protein
MLYLPIVVCGGAYQLPALVGRHWTSADFIKKIAEPAFLCTIRVIPEAIVKPSGKGSQNGDFLPDSLL